MASKNIINLSQAQSDTTGPVNAPLPATQPKTLPAENLRVKRLI